ncbi:DUF2442 domain-containing protein [Sphingomonas profundi]|uniref:DUF2442 domain-containing protein n=1 Tax=Alterirhizorhabdus profundi TaxID=2681549 RepID=UPI0012E72D92|nr:DUF2442 domain-containing protein [Sphingomonas profundi]
MIKLTRIEVVGDHELELTFNDGQSGRWSAAGLIARDTVLTRPLGDPAYFARAFNEAGALAWSNGLELAPKALANQLLRASGDMTETRPFKKTNAALY